MEEGGSRRKFKYQPQLDGLRAVAVAGVVLFHLHYLKGGYVGVDLFFVLSGFLITSLLLRERDRTGGVAYRQFYLRRARRLLPALVVLCIVVLVLSFLLAPHHRHETQLGVVASLFYLSAWLEAFGASGLGAMGHTWSLSVEEYFYFVWPAVLMLVVMRWPRRAVVNACIVAAIAVAYQLSATYVFHWSVPRTYFGPDTRADQLIVGCALAVLIARGGLRLPHRGRPSRAVPIVLVVASIGVLAGIALKSGPLLHFYAGGWITLVTAAGTCIVGWLFLAPHSPLSKLLATPVFVWTGRRSYGIYLWHYSLIYFLLPHVHHKAELAVIVIVLTVVISALSYRFIEEPIRRNGLPKLRLNPVD